MLTQNKLLATIINYSLVGSQYVAAQYEMYTRQAKHFICIVNVA